MFKISSNIFFYNALTELLSLGTALLKVNGEVIGLFERTGASMNKKPKSDSTVANDFTEAIEKKKTKPNPKI